MSGASRDGGKVAGHGDARTGGQSDDGGGGRSRGGKSDERADRRTRESKFVPRHVLVTGAAGAIGGALARRMRDAWPNARLALLDRATDRSTDRATASLEALAGALGNASVHGVDLRDVDALPSVLDSIERDAEPLDGLVNCAGIMRVQQLQTWKWDEARDLVTIDLIAPLRLQDLVVRTMVERGGGVIVNVASMAGKVPLKGCTYYGASKAGLAMASEIARADLAPHGVRVVTVYPGPVKSPLEAGARADYGGGGMFGRFAPLGDPDELARRIMHAIAHDEPRVIYPRLYNVGWSATNLSSWFALSYGPAPVA